MYISVNYNKKQLFLFVKIIDDPIKIKAGN